MYVYIGRFKSINKKGVPEKMFFKSLPSPVNGTVFFLKHHVCIWYSIMLTYAARVDALMSGTEHVVHDAAGGVVAVGGLALGIVPDVDGHLLEHY